MLGGVMGARWSHTILSAEKQAQEIQVKKTGWEWRLQGGSRGKEKPKEKKK